MAITHSDESKLTDRYQTTVPLSVRRALHLRKGDRIFYSVSPAGQVVIARAVAPEPEDAALEPFLRLLAGDIATRPEKLRSPDTSLVKRIRSLTRGAKIDPESALSPDDE